MYSLIDSPSFCFMEARVTEDTSKSQSGKRCRNFRSRSFQDLMHPGWRVPKNNLVIIASLFDTEPVSDLKWQTCSLASWVPSNEWRAGTLNPFGYGSASHSGGRAS